MNHYRFVLVCIITVAGCSKPTTQNNGSVEVIPMKKKFSLALADLKPLAEGHGGCFATDMITVEGRGVGYMYRDKPGHEMDSGWRFFSGQETQDYVDDLSNTSIYDVNVIANYSPDIIPFLRSPIGAQIERDLDGNLSHIVEEQRSVDPVENIAQKIEAISSLRIETTGNDKEIASWVWENLVPDYGQAETVQGELLRAIEKLRWEAKSNGNINWDNGFEILIEFLRSTLTNAQCFDPATLKIIENDLDRLNNFITPDQLSDKSQAHRLPYVEDDLYDRLVEHVVAFCKVHPEALPRAPDPNLHR